MVCASTCWLAGALLGGFGLISWYSLRLSQRGGSALQDSLTPEQAERYAGIKDMRRNLAIQGLILGALVAIAYLIGSQTEWVREALLAGRTGPSATQLVCNSIAIVLSTTYFYYMLRPKSDYMVKHLQPAQMDAYMESNRAYQVRWTGGLLLGAAGAYFLGRGICT